MPLPRRFFAPLTALVATLAVAAPAQATVTATQVTTPAHPQFVLYQPGAAQPATVDVAGTATGSGNVDVVCTQRFPYGQTVFTVLAHDVPVNANGAFSVSDAPLDEAAHAEFTGSEGASCRLRGVPAGTTPADLGAFAGPTLAISKLERFRSGAAGGVVSDYSLFAAGLGFSARANAFSDYGGVLDYVHDPVTLEALSITRWIGGNLAARNRYHGLFVDGEPAWTPAASESGAPGGLPAVDVELVRFSPVNGNLTVRETDALSGASSARLPVVLERTLDFSHDTQVVRVVDRWSSTDGRPHRLELHLGEMYCLGGFVTGCSRQPEYRFPGSAAYERFDVDDTAPPLAAMKPILIRGEAGGGGAAIVPEQEVDGARWDSPFQFRLQYRDRTIPPNGALTLAHTYATTRSAGEIDAFTQGVIAELTPAAPAGPAPAANAGGATATALPQLSRRGRIRVRRSGRTFRVVTGDRVSCPAGGPACAVQIGGKRIAASRARVGAGHSTSVGFRLTRAGARALLRLGRLRLTVVLSARAGSAPAVSTRRSVTIRLSPRPRNLR